MADVFVHTVHRDGRWENTIEGENGPLPGVYATKTEAVAVGRGEARRRQTEHVIHREDSSIKERNSTATTPVTAPAERARPCRRRPPNTRKRSSRTISTAGRFPAGASHPTRLARFSRGATHRMSTHEASRRASRPRTSRSQRSRLRLTRGAVMSAGSTACSISSADSVDHRRSPAARRSGPRACLALHAGASWWKVRGPRALRARRSPPPLLLRRGRSAGTLSQLRGEALSTEPDVRRRTLTMGS